MKKALFIRHHTEDHPGLIGEALAARGFDLEVWMMNEESSAPSLEDVDALVVLGSKHAVYDQSVIDAWFGRELELLAEAVDRDVPVLGICFGAQALCRLFGGSVAKSQSPEVGWYEVSPVGDSPIARGPWFQFHYDACTLPESATVLAVNENAVQAFSFGKNLGVQFHPELDGDQLADWLAGGGDEDARDFGHDLEELLAQTHAETPAARTRANDLVQVFLDQAGL